MGGLSVRWVIKYLGGVQQNWGGQCEIVGRIGVSCRRGTIWNDQRSLLIPAGGLGRCEPPSGSRAESLWGPGGKAAGSSWNFAFSSI